MVVALALDWDSLPSAIQLAAVKFEGTEEEKRVGVQVNVFYNDEIMYV